MGFFRPTWAEIRLNALRHNFRQISRMLKPGTRVMAMVKADAYGHGAVAVSRVLAELGVAALAVATVEEGMELRESGIETPILVLGGLMGLGSPAAGMIIGAGLIPVVHSASVLRLLEAVAAASERQVGIHLKVDTGMTRLGIMPSALPDVLNKLNECSHLKLEGVMTHFADGDDEEFTPVQIETFSHAVEQIKNAFGNIPVWHVANSAGILSGFGLDAPAGSECWVRPGIMLYGANPNKRATGDAPTFVGVQRRLPAVALAKAGATKLKPVMHLKSRVALIKSVPENTFVSYGRTYKTARPSKIGILPIGYADGYPWALSNKAAVLIRGMRVPVVGCVTMDMTMIDLTDVADRQVGDEVTLLGQHGEQLIGVEELADWVGTIPYEIFCGISKRMPRIYVE